ncbi:MAG: extracellular solute-binding protein [Rhodobacterales bacterium]|nr:extracellular solute-binding protein [Rhodobacterales bacterium]
MKYIVQGASALAIMAAPAFAESGEITIWSWNIGASSLQATVAGFNAIHPDVTVTVEDIGNQQVFDRMLAACAAGGVGLPDIVSVENAESEIFWAQFPDCFANLRDLGYTEEMASAFPDYKRIELEVGDAAYAMPWDSGPVMMFYRRDMYEAAGVDPASIVTWADFAEAGKAIMAANPGVVMTQADINGSTDFFQMIGGENSCQIFDNAATGVTVGSTACAETLDTVKGLVDQGLLTAADWGEKLTSASAGTVATHMYGGWYEGSIRTTVPEDQIGLWGVYRMPSVKADGPRAANLGGSALAISNTSQNKEAAFAYLAYTLGTVEGQVTMLREYGLVPSLLAALDDPYVQEPLSFWGGQQVWVDTLATMPDVVPLRGTQFYFDASPIITNVQLAYINGQYATAQDAVDEMAKQISLVTGLPVM